MIRTLDLNKLPDNGELLLKKRNSLEQDLAEAEKVLENMVAKKGRLISFFFNGNCANLSSFNEIFS